MTDREMPSASDRLQDRISELLKERDQWQESSGQNYVRAQDAEDREEKLERRIEELEAALEDIAAEERAFIADPIGEAGVTHRKAAIARRALKDGE